MIHTDPGRSGAAGSATTKPYISVIVPLYNKEAHIRRCLDSVRAQTYANYEIIVIDDGSTDRGADIAGACLRETDRLIHQRNAGAAAARNRGFAAMHGTLAALLDADDEWLPSHLGCLIELDARFPRVGLLSTGIALQGAGGFTLCSGINSREPRLFADYFATCRCEPNPVNSSSCAVRRSVLEEVGGQIAGAHRGEDLEFFARIGLRWPIALHPAITTVCHLDAENRSTVIRPHAEDFPVTVLKLAETLRAGDVPPALRESVYDYLRYCIMASLRNAMLSRDINRVTTGLNSPLIEEFDLTAQARAMRRTLRLPLSLILAAHRVKSLRWLIMPNQVCGEMRTTLHRIPPTASREAWSTLGWRRVRTNPSQGAECALGPSISFNEPMEKGKR